MREEDFLDLLKEIETMSIEEYNTYHKQALKMRESCFYIQDSFTNSYQVGNFEISAFVDNKLIEDFSKTESVFISKKTACNELFGEDDICQIAA